MDKAYRGRRTDGLTTSFSRVVFPWAWGGHHPLVSSLQQLHSTRLQGRPLSQRYIVHRGGSSGCHRFDGKFHGRGFFLFILQYYYFLLDVVGIHPLR